MILYTDRLILRRWEVTEAEEMFKYASDPDIGPITGWPPHESIEDSQYVIENVLTGEEAYAICLREDNKPIGTIELKLGEKAELAEGGNGCELGYWLGKPFWGQGIVPEASRELIRHAFDDLGFDKIWCGYYDGNRKSMRAQEKLGFKYQGNKLMNVPLMNEERIVHISLLTKEDWLKGIGKI